MAKERFSNHVGSIEYELIVKGIYERILKKEGVENIEVQHNQSVLGKTGVSHQVDVLWRLRIAGIEHLVLIECKNYGSTVELGDVRNFQSVVEEVNGARGVMVTRVGFQSGAVTFAKHHGIGLKLVRPAEDKDWEGFIRKVDVHLSVKSFDRSRPPTIEFGVPKEFASDVEGARIKNQGIDLQLRDQAGNPSTPRMQRWFDENIPILDKEAGGPYRHSVEFTDTFLLFEKDGIDDKLVPVTHAKVTFWVSEYNQTIHIDADDVVTYILKDFLTGEVEHFGRNG